MGNMVPVTFAASPILTHFEVSLYFVTNEGFMKPDTMKRILSALLQFLSSCPVLESFAMHLESMWAPVGISLGRSIKLTTIKTLDFKFRSCSSLLVKSVVDAACFPNASALKLQIINAKIGLPPQDTLHAVFSKPSPFPRLEKLDLQFRVMVTWEGDDEHRTVRIPFVGIPNVQHLALTSHNVYLAPIPELQRLPTLRSLTFSACQLLEKDWVAKLLGRLKDQGNIPQLTVLDCQWRPGDDDAQFDAQLEAQSIDLSDDSDEPDLSITVNEMLSLIP